MHPLNKHSYLQSRTEGINPRILNRSIDLARDQPTIDGCDFDPGYNRLTSQTPSIPSEHLDVTRRPLAFGRWALPKLMRELHHEDNQIVLQSVTSLTDLLHDPEKVYQALKLKIPDRLADLLSHELPEIRERVCITLIILAGVADGRAAIVQNKLLLDNLAKLMDDQQSGLRFKAAMLLEMLSRSWFAGDFLVDAGFIKLILNRIYQENGEIRVIYLETLISLMYAEGKDQALTLGAFDLFVACLEDEAEPVVAKAADCLLMLTSTRSAKDIAFDKQILKRLTKLLYHDNSEIYTSVASAIMFCTVKSEAKIQAKQLPKLLERLIILTNHWKSQSTQLFCMKSSNQPTHFYN
ncbi:radial spoke head 14 homolog isoform X2 [Photinus pyralis]|uniref:radial spoke head 14 homolog isoform X2 n=1 Tax=Photinus pyralis TaxID=7054 RepID=UPI001266EB35|nr:radial spoke head 14 homolog isoform X2 [Photinus pyralis]